MKPIHHHIRILNRLRRGFGTAALLGILIPQLAVANPLGPQVISGQASFATQGRTLSITNSDRAIINWQNFSIANGELTRFIQPTATSAVLNRVIGNNPSAIYGALQSNGRVYLVNQNGIFMGPTATIDVNGLVASTLNITDNDFKAGRINFSGGPLAGKIENQGAIRTPAGGSIYLIAPDVTNSGIINAPNGDILLAAGQQVSLVESTTPEIAVVISAPENQILNLGRIIAEAGRIGIYGGLIQHRGIASADSAVMDKTGAIHFRATNDITLDKDSSTTANGPQGGTITVQSAKGTTLVSGAIEAKGSSEKGGTVQLLGRRVGVIDAAQIDASGEQGGGTVLVGGDYQGKNPAVPNAEATYFGVDARIRADAVASGDGGKVILWSNDGTRFYGSIGARGGAAGGDGGFAEVSGKKKLGFSGFVDLSARKGKAGTLLLDPDDLTIGSDPGGGAIQDTDNPFQAIDGVNSYYATKASLEALLATNVVLHAHHDIIFNASLNMPNIVTGWGITVDAVNAINMASNDITTGGGDLTMTAGTGGINNTGNINAPLATVGLTSGGGISQAASTSISAQNLNLNAPGSITQGAGSSIVVSALALAGGGAYTLDSTSNSIGNVRGTVGSLDLKSNIAGITVNAAGLNVTNSLTLSSLYYVAVNGPINGNTIMLEAQGGGTGPLITQNAAGVITTPSLSTNSTKGTKLDVASNTVTSFNATNTTSGDISFKNTALTLTVAGITQSAAGGLSVNNTGNINITGPIGGVAVASLTATGGTISQTAGGTVAAFGLNTSSVGGVTLNSANTVGDNFSATNTGGGAISLVNTAPTLNVASITQTAGAGISVDNTGKINITGAIGGGAVTNLTASGAITQSTSFGITTPGLNANSTGGMTLLSPYNTLTSFSGSNTGGATTIALRNDGAGVLTIGGVTNNASGIAPTSSGITINSVNAAGTININGLISTASGGVSIDSAGPITVGEVPKHVTGTYLSAYAHGGIGTIATPLKTTIGTLYAANDQGGNTVITNTGALVIDTLTSNSNGTLGLGNIRIDNTGSVTTGVNLVQGYGDVTIIANSPLTIGAGGVTSTAGNINLTAGVTGPGMTGDTLTLNGPLIAMPVGNITLSAGNGIIKNSTIAAGGALVESPNLNGPAPTPTCTGGQYWDGTACVCPTGQSLSGYVCQPIICPTGQQLVGNTCQPIICPTGQQLVGNTCQPIICPTGQQLVGNICQPIICPTGQQLVGNTCQAITCPTGQQLVGNTCQPIICPTGQQLVGNTCQPIICPTGQQLVGSLCQPIICPTGQKLVGNTCQAIICPTGQQLVGNLCQPIICTGGQQLVGNLCTCPGGQVFIGAGCQCPAGTIDYAGVCKTPSIVPGTDTTTVIYFPVTEELSEPLQVLVESIINTVAPSLFRTSGSGSPGGGAGDDLKPKKNYCN